MLVTRPVHSATALGLRGAPANEILYRDRMLAHHDMGNISGIDGDIRDLCAALDVEDPCDELHPETLALFERLTNRAPNQVRSGSRSERMGGPQSRQPRLIRCRAPPRD